MELHATVWNQIYDDAQIVEKFITNLVILVELFRGQAILSICI